MRRLVRLTLMWLLAVALPLQGVSAATMIACGAGHHQQDSAAAVTGHSAGHVHTHVAAQTAHEHAEAHHAFPAKTDLAKTVGHKCSACASCCLSAAVPTALISFDAVRLPDSFASLVPRTLAAYVNEGLERPPRSFLA